MPHAAPRRLRDREERARDIVRVDERPGGGCPPDHRGPPAEERLSHYARVPPVGGVESAASERPRGKAVPRPRIPRDPLGLQSGRKDWVGGGRRVLVERRPIGIPDGPDDALLNVRLGSDSGRGFREGSRPVDPDPIVLGPLPPRGPQLRRNLRRGANHDVGPFGGPCERIDIEEVRPSRFPASGAHGRLAGLVSDRPDDPVAPARQAANEPAAQHPGRAGHEDLHATRRPIPPSADAATGVTGVPAAPRSVSTVVSKSTLPYAPTKPPTTNSNGNQGGFEPRPPVMSSTGPPAKRPPKIQPAIPRSGVVTRRARSDGYRVTTKSMTTAGTRMSARPSANEAASGGERDEREQRCKERPDDAPLPQFREERRLRESRIREDPAESPERVEERDERSGHRDVQQPPDARDRGRPEPGRTRENHEPRHEAET